jgi:hypothetical protein
MKQYSGRSRILPRPCIIEVDYRGLRWRGNYSVQSGRIDVWSEFGRKQAATGGVPDEQLAKILLLEIVQDRPR